MLDYETGIIRKLDLGFILPPSGPGIQLLLNGERSNGYVILTGSRSWDDMRKGIYGTALVTLERSCKPYSDIPMKKHIGKTSENLREMTRA